MGYQPGSLPGWEFPGSLDPKIAARPNTPRCQRLFQEASLTEILPHCIWNWPVIIYIYILVGLSPHVLSFEKPVVNAIGYGDAYQLTGSPFATLGKRCEKKCRTPSCARGSRLSYFLLAVVHCRHFGRGPSFVLMHSLEQIPWIFNLVVRSVTGRCSLRDSCR